MKSQEIIKVIRIYPLVPVNVGKKKNYGNLSNSCWIEESIQRRQ